MSSFHLKIVTPNGLMFDGKAEKLIVRTTEGDMAVLANHINCVAALGTGCATIADTEGNRRYAACMGGMLSMVDGNATLVSSSFKWAASMDDAHKWIQESTADKS